MPHESNQEQVQENQLARGFSGPVFLEVGKGGGEKLGEPYPYFYFMSSIPCIITIVKSVLSSVMFEKKCQMNVASDYFCVPPPPPPPPTFPPSIKNPR